MKIGFVGVDESGHLQPMTALARKLKSRGSDVGLEVVWYTSPELMPWRHRLERLLMGEVYDFRRDVTHAGAARSGGNGSHLRK
jgi:UDP:flavonoid glycosyltransferase YjiC (YdhE family)